MSFRLGGWEEKISVRLAVLARDGRGGMGEPFAIPDCLEVSRRERGLAAKGSCSRMEGEAAARLCLREGFWRELRTRGEAGAEGEESEVGVFER